MKHNAIARVIIGGLFFIGSLSAGPVWAKDKKPVHPVNKQLLQLGLIKKVPAYYPQIPRIPAAMALGLYKSGKALFLYVSYKNLHIIPGAIHLTEGQVGNINISQIPIKKGQVLVTYCP
jgi:hypothetical protein